MKLMSWFHPPGTAPGTLAESVHAPGPTRETLYTYSAEQLQETPLTSSAELGQGSEGVFRWLDIEGRDVALIGDLGTHLGVHRLVMEDVVNVGQRPKIEEYDSCVFLVVDLVTRAPGSTASKKEQVSIVLQNDLVVSFREGPGPVFESVVKRLRGGKGRIRTGGPDYLAYALIDAVVDHYFPVLDALGTEMEAVEESLFQKPLPEDLAAVHRLRRDALLLRRSVWPLREMLSHVMRSEDPLLRDDTKVYFRDVADHLDLIAGMIETYLEMLTGLQNLYLSTLSHQTNEIMRVLTIIASIFIPLSFIAGLYGMNFSAEASPLNMPELTWRFGYPAVLLLMAGTAAGLLIFLRRRRWI